MILALVAGIALGLSPATYPLVPVVVGYAGGRKNVTPRRAALLSLALVAGITTVYVVLGALWGSFGLLLLDLLSRLARAWRICVDSSSSLHGSFTPGGYAT